MDLAQPGRDAIDALEDEGIVAEISDPERYRMYEAPEVLDIVESP